VTHDPKHLWRAWKFAEFAVGPEGYRYTTRPSSIVLHGSVSEVLMAFPLWVVV
jgi:ABC-type glycerol-3-phosphate transport system substrate-binding protein